MDSICKKVRLKKRCERETEKVNNRKKEKEIVGRLEKN